MNTYLWPFYPIGIGILFVLVLIAKNKRKEWIMETQLSTKEAIIKNQKEGIETLEKVMIKQGEEIFRLKNLLTQALGGKPTPKETYPRKISLNQGIVKLTPEATELLLQILEEETKNN